MLHICSSRLQPRPGEGGRAAEGSGLARSASAQSEIEPAERLLKSEEGLAPLTPKTRQARHTTPREVCHSRFPSVSQPPGGICCSTAPTPARSLHCLARTCAVETDRFHSCCWMSVTHT